MSLEEWTEAKTREWWGKTTPVGSPFSMLELLRDLALWLDEQRAAALVDGTLSPEDLGMKRQRRSSEGPLYVAPSAANDAEASR